MSEEDQPSSEEMTSAPGGSDHPESETEAAEFTTPTLAEILEAAEELWPESLAEDWDAVGLVAGRLDQKISQIVFAVDPTEEVINDAINSGAQLVITHHPLLLRGVNSVAATTAKGRVVHQLIENGCSLLTAHTNGDSAVGGVSDVLADAIGLNDVSPLRRSKDGLPEEGIGRVGTLESAVTLEALAEKVFGILPAVAGGVRVSGDRQALVRTVAVCGGAGDSLIQDVLSAGADVYIAADFRHHATLEAREHRLDARPFILDVSHFASEWLWLPAAAQALANVLEDQGFTVEIRVSQVNSDPWDFILTPS